MSDHPTSVAQPPSPSPPTTVATSSSFLPTSSQTLDFSTNQSLEGPSHGQSLCSHSPQQAIPISSNVNTYIQPSPSIYFPTQLRHPPPPLLSINQSPGPSSHASYSCHSANQFTWSPLLPSVIPATHSPTLETNNNPFFLQSSLQSR